MNSASRLLNQGSLSRSWVISVVLAKTQFATLVLTVGVLMSALSTIYVTNSVRGLHAAIQQALAERNKLHVQWGQLLLEKSTWITPVRVQFIAENKMRMVVPDNKSTVIVNE